MLHQIIYLKDLIAEKYFTYVKRPWVIKTKLPKSSWHETDERMLWAVMELVRFYVEEDGSLMTTREALANDPYFQSLDPLNKHQLEEKNQIIRQMEDDERITDVYNWFKDYKVRFELGEIGVDVNNSEQEYEEATGMMIEACLLRSRMWS